MPADDSEDRPLTEPVIVSEVLITGGHIEVSADIVRFTGWTDLQMPDANGERRVVTRMAMSIEVALALIEKFRQTRQTLS